MTVTGIRNVDVAPRHDVVLEVGTKRVSARTPRSGTLWSPRYFVRRTAWHVLDHAWEIEDRSRPDD